MENLLLKGLNQVVIMSDYIKKAWITSHGNLSTLTIESMFPHNEDCKRLHVDNANQILQN